MVGLNIVDMLDSDSETFKIENNGTSYYFGYVFMILVLFNIICIAIYCYKKRSTNTESTYNEHL